MEPLNYENVTYVSYQIYTPCSSNDPYVDILKLLCEVISKIEVIVGKNDEQKFTFSLDLQIVSLLLMKNQNSCP